MIIEVHYTQNGKNYVHYEAEDDVLDDGERWLQVSGFVTELATTPEWYERTINEVSIKFDVAVHV